MGAGHPEAVDVADVVVIFDVLLDGADVLVCLVCADVGLGGLVVWVCVCFGVGVCFGVLLGAVEAFNEVVGAPKAR